MSKDFDALGRYKDAEEKLTKAIEERYEILKFLNNSSSGFSLKDSLKFSNTVVGFNIKRLQNYVEDISRVEGEIKSAVSIMNEYAPSCGKPILKIEI